MAYGFVRNSIAKDIIGGKDFIKYVPLLFSLFFFILVNNIYGAIPVIQLPSFSHVAAPTCWPASCTSRGSSSVSRRTA